MKRINITCPACGSRAYLRPASVVYGDKAPDPDAKYYVCGRYHGTARLGIEALELRVRGYSCADIAKLYQKKPNYIGACISRAAEKLRRERIVREFYTACTEQDIKSA